MSIVDLHKKPWFLPLRILMFPWNFGMIFIAGCQHSLSYGYGSIPINTIFRGMNIHLPAILMFTRGTRFWHTAIWPSKIWPPDLGVSRRRDSMPFHGLEQVHFPSVRRPFMMGSCCWSNRFIFYMNPYSGIYTSKTANVEQHPNVDFDFTLKQLGRFYPHYYSFHSRNWTEGKSTGSPPNIFLVTI